MAPPLQPPSKPPGRPPLPPPHKTPPAHPDGPSQHPPGPTLSDLPLDLTPPSSISLELETLPAPQTSETPSSGEGISISGLSDSPGSFEIESSRSMVSLGASPTPSQNTAQDSFPLRIQPGGRKTKSPAKKLILWNQDLLQSSPDPLGKGICEALKDYGVAALFLALTENSEFVSTAALIQSPFSQNRIELWTGLKWDSKIMPESWNALVQNGHIEFPPPGSFTSASSHRNLARAAFGILADEFLLLVRAGPTQACRGIVALVSTQSLVVEGSGIESALTKIASPAPSSESL